MARTNLKVISVYFDDQGYDLVKKAASLENRSMSNFAQTVVLQAADERLSGTALADMVVTSSEPRTKDKKRS